MTATDSQPGSARTPELSVKLSLSSDECHLSGSPAFTITTTVTLDAAGPITVDATRTILQDGARLMWNVFEIVELDTDEVVDQGDLIGCWEGGPPDTWRGFLDVRTLRPDEPLTARKTFAKDQDDYDGLTPGKRYALRVAKGHAVPHWRWGTKEDVLAPENGDRIGWSEPATLRLDHAEPVEFTAVP